MARDLLNHWPDWVLGVVFIGGSVILTLGGLALVRRFLPGWRVVDSVDHVIGVAAMVMTLFALILAFVLFNLNSDYDSASAEVTAEANSLGALVLDARAFPTREQRLINAAVGRYVAEVRDHEFASLAKGHEDPLAQQLLYGVFAAVQRYSPVTGTQTAFYRSATAELTVIVGQHEARTAQAEGSIPPPLLALLILLAMMTLTVTLLLCSRHPALDVALIVGVAVIVGAGVLTAVILQYPYSGSIAVTSAPFAHGVLAQVGSPPG
jgi:hypothetical protein